MDPFLADVIAGLSSTPKRLSSKYFYDDAGSQIFQEIMAMPEYYLTNCEREILVEQAMDLAAALGEMQNLQVIELGAGDGDKTIAMLRQWQAAGLQFVYHPIDVSQGALDDLVRTIHGLGVDIAVEPLCGDYFECLQHLKPSQARLFLFLGANIGNYDRAQCLDLLGRIRSAMSPADHLLIGFDLQKNPAVVKLAYDDPAGITKRFNINLLHRINRELGANFIPAQFSFVCTYNPANGEIKSYLQSELAQTVAFPQIQQAFSFEPGEWIQTELSKKYSIAEIEALAQDAGFQVVRHFADRAQYFVDSLWTAI